jgi:DNA-binding MarR family transcriptional regulator
MRQIGSILRCNDITSRPSGNRYRRGSVFVMDPRAHSTPLDRNQRAKILAQAEAIERRTKVKGRRSGVLGLTGLAVLRALVLQYNNGICNPSYSELQRRTGFCRQTIARALRALEAVGLIRVVRRLVRKVVDGIVRVVQGTNLYAFQVGGLLNIGPLPIARSMSFPRAKALISLMSSIRLDRVCGAGSSYIKGCRDRGSIRAGNGASMGQV